TSRRKLLTMASTITIEVTGYHDKPISQSIHADFDEKGGTIGRGPENTLVLLDPERKISRTHATLTFAGGRFTLKDQGSIAPVVLNGRPLGNGNEAPLAPGDEIRIAGYAMTVRGAPQVTEEPRIAQAPIPETKEPEPLVAEAKVEAEVAEPLAAEAAAGTQSTKPGEQPPPAVETEMPEPVLSWTSQDAPGSVDATTIILAAASAPDEE